MRHPRILATALGSVLLMLVAGACGDDGDEAIPQTGNRPTTTAAGETGETGDGGFPVTIDDAANAPVEIPAQPERIVSLSPTATEMLFAIGAGDQVVAVDDQSDYPEGVPTTDLSGFETNVEAVSAEEPDLVVMANDNNDAFAGFAELSIPVLQLPPATTVDDTYSQFDQLGRATGHVDEAAAAAETLRSEIDSIVSEAGDQFADVTIYHELDETGYTATTDTFIGQLYETVGLRNIATQTSTDGSGYVQLSAEFAVEQNPEWIFLAYPVDGDPVAAVSGRPGWDQLDAVQNGQVVALDPDIASRWGPRTGQLLQLIVDAIGGGSAGAGSGGVEETSSTTAEAA